MRRSVVSIRILILSIMVGLAAACSQGTSEAPAPDELRVIDLGEQVSWASVDGAVEYRIQFWAQTRLLFEEVREGPVLAITPAMDRSLLGVETAGMQVRAYAADGELLGQVQRREFRAPLE